VELRFSENVESGFGALRVFDRQGRRIDKGNAFHPDGYRSRLAVRLSPRPPDGSVTVTWRVVSADGHVVSGGYVFAIGSPSSPVRSVADLVGSDDVGAGADATLAVGRTIQFGAIAVALGAVLFLLFVWDRIERLRIPGTASSAADLRERLELLLRLAAAGGIAASLIGLAGQGALASGSGVVDALSMSIIRELLGTRFGSVWALAAIAWLAILLLAREFVRRRRVAVLALAPAFAWLAATPALSGHAATIEPTGLMASAGILHVCAISAWVGGVLALVACALPVLARSGSPQLLESVVGRFSGVALAAVAVTVATGSVQALIALGSVGSVLTTGYGRLVLAKAMIVAVLIGFATLLRRKLIPAIGAPATSGLAIRRARRILFGETALFAAAIGITAVLAAQPPSGSADAGPVTRAVIGGSLRIEMTVDPARVGTNAVHLYLTDARNGSRDTSADEVTVSAEPASGETGAIAQPARRAGPGHWIAPALGLPIAGRWRFVVTVRTSEFEQEEGATTVQVE